MATQRALVMSTVRLPTDVHEALRRIAFEQRRSIHSLLIEAAKAIVADYRAETDRRTEAA